MSLLTSNNLQTEETPSNVAQAGHNKVAVRASTGVTCNEKYDALRDDLHVSQSLPRRLVCRCRQQVHEAALMGHRTTVVCVTFPLPLRSTARALSVPKLPKA